MPDPSPTPGDALFARALEHVLRWEGGDKLTDDPRDAGGLTRWGISQRAYPDLDIRSLTREHATELYQRDYWDACGCGELEPGVALCVFDAAVNCGVQRALKWLEAAKRWRHARNIIDSVTQARLAHYRGLSAYRWFGRGWEKRALATQRAALREQGLG